MTASEGLWHLVGQPVWWLAATPLGGSALLSWIKARQRRPGQRLILLSHLVRQGSGFRSRG